MPVSVLPRTSNLWPPYAPSAVGVMSKTAPDFWAGNGVNVDVDSVFETAVSGGMLGVKVTSTGVAGACDFVYSFVVRDNFSSWPGTATGPTADLCIVYMVDVDADADVKVTNVEVYDAPDDDAAAPASTVYNVTDRSSGRIDGTTDSSRGLPAAVTTLYRLTDSIAGGAWTPGRFIRVKIQVSVPDNLDALTIFEVRLSYNTDV